MEHNRKIKILSILALLVAIAGMTLGFAAFSATINISSSASVTPSDSTFIVKFSTKQNELDEGEVVPSSISSGITATNGVIDNSSSPKITNLSATFTKPGQYVEYTFYARNEGEYKAYLNSVNFFGDKLCEAVDDASKILVDSACSSINLTAYVAGEEYSETTPITNHYLDKNVGEEVKVRIDYDSLGTAVDGQFSITLGDVIMVYSTIDDSTYIPSGSTLTKKRLLDIVKEGAISDASVSFDKAPVTGKYIRSGTENDAYPIYYYRGEVTNNNVKFANFCWKAVRTTETGGVKLIYNGVPAEDGSCNNTGTNSQIGKSAFNSSSNSLAYVGYMYGIVYTATTKDLSSQTDTYVYGNDVTWDGTNYSLTGTTTSSCWSADYNTLATKYHYTCFNDTGMCANVYYINSFSASMTYYLTLSNGKDIEGAKKEMFKNDKDSTIKRAIDTWYSSNMIIYTSKLEDTVWCNDRTLSNGPLYSKDANGKGVSSFEAYARNMSSFKPSLSCDNALDKFTVKTTTGNGKLTYPVGLLTADEYTLAGSGNKGYSTSSYLHTGQYQWSLSPYYYGNNNATEFTLTSSGTLLNNYGGGYTLGVRPSVSLKLGTLVSDGDGSVNNPYVIE